MKSLDIFKEMMRQSIPPNIAMYHKIIEIIANTEEVDDAEQLIDEFAESHMKHLCQHFLP
jgi:hypothetical protein